MFCISNEDEPRPGTDCDTVQATTPSPSFIADTLSEDSELDAPPVTIPAAPPVKEVPTPGVGGTYPSESSEAYYKSYLPSLLVLYD